MRYIKWLFMIVIVIIAASCSPSLITFRKEPSLIHLHRIALFSDPSVGGVLPSRLFLQEPPLHIVEAVYHSCHLT